jgi:hypothetical protein
MVWEWNLYFILISDLIYSIIKSKKNIPEAGIGFVVTARQHIIGSKSINYYETSGK